MILIPIYKINGILIPDPVLIPTDTIEFVDSIEVQGIGRVSSSDTLSVTDNAVVSGIGRISSSDAVEVIDTVTIQGISSFSVSDTLNFTDSAEVITAGTIAANDIIQFADTCVLLGFGSLTISDTTTFTDSVLVRLTEFAISVSDSTNFIDSCTVRGIGSISVNDSTVFRDFITFVNTKTAFYAMQDKVYFWVSQVFPTYQVFWRDQNIVSKQLSFPHITLKVLTVGTISESYTKPTFTGVSNKVLQKSAIVSVNCFSKTSLEAVDILDTLIDSLIIDDIKAGLRLENISIVKKSNPQDTSFELDNITEKKANCEFTVYYVDEKFDASSGVINEVNMHVKLDSHEFNKTFSGDIPCQ